MIYLGTSSTPPLATVGDSDRAIDLASGVRHRPLPPAWRLPSPNSVQTVSSITAGVGHPADFGTGWRSQRQRQGRLPQGPRSHHRAGFGQHHGRPRPAPPARRRRQSDRRRLDAERQRQDHHLPQRADRRLQRTLPPARASSATRHRRQRQLDRLLQGGDGHRHAEGDRYRHRRPDRERSPPVRRRLLPPPARPPLRSMSAACVKLSTGTAADLAITGTGNALSVLGLTGATGTDTNFSACPYRRRRRHQRQDPDLLRRSTAAPRSTSPSATAPAARSRPSTSSMPSCRPTTRPRPSTRPAS